VCKEVRLNLGSLRGSSGKEVFEAQAPLKRKAEKKALQVAEPAIVAWKRVTTVEPRAGRVGEREESNHVRTQLRRKSMGNETSAHK
jgi:hypothetical protein